MRTLYHYWLCPFSRKVRIVLAEKHFDFQLVFESYWECRSDFLLLNPAGLVPVMVVSTGNILCDSMAIAEYLDEIRTEPALIGNAPEERAETRRLCAWFDKKFNDEVTLNLVFEKVVKRHALREGPDSRYVRAGYANINAHLDYTDWLLDQRNWLAGNFFSLADITAAAHLSCIDYLGDVPWDKHPETRDWYARIKSRPSMRPILADRISGLTPPRHYDDLDF